MSVENARLMAASGRAAMAYDVARAEVYVHYPHGLPARECLSRRERALLDDLERENATLEQLRRDQAPHVNRSTGSER